MPQTIRDKTFQFKDLTGNFLIIALMADEQ